MNDRELLQQALDSLEWAERRYSHANLDLFNKPIEAIRTRLAQPEPEPVAYGFQNTAVTGSNRWLMLREEVPTDDQYDGQLWTPLYTAPPAKEWAGLTDDEYELMAEKRVTNYFFNTLDYAHDIEAKLRDKNS